MPNLPYHITRLGNNRARVLRNDAERKLYLEHFQAILRASMVPQVT